MIQANPDRRQIMEQEMTVEELIALMDACEGDFMIQIELKEDADERRDKTCE